MVSEVIVKPLTHTFSSGIVPQELKLAKIIPIYKAEDPPIFTNYRPTSILPSILSILEKLAYNRCLNLDKNEISHKHQYGFRKSCSTYMAVTHLANELHRANDNKEYTNGIFFDLSKAFDTVYHLILLQKLNYLGLRE